MEPYDHLGHMINKKQQERAALEQQISLIDAEVRGLEQARSVIAEANGVKERFAEVVSKTGKRNR